mgnify:CR=1 FL=1
MKSGLFILIVCLLFPAYVCADTSKHALEENRKLLHSLDSLLEQQDLFVRVKEERIKQLKMQYSRVKDVKELYAMNRMVYLEYRVYDADSALHYINKNIQLAQQTNNRTWEVVSLLEQSFVLTSSGLLTEALKAVSDIQPEELPQNLRSEYLAGYVHSIPACGITPVRTPNCRNITIISKRPSETRYTSQPLPTNCATGTAGHGSTWEPRK